jgi:predicted dehydrogenase
MAPEKTLEVAVIGCGLVAASHLAALRKVARAKPVAVCDLNEQMARKLAKQFSVPHYFTDVSELLSNVHPHVCHITTPPRTHLPLALQVLQIGSHLLLEKPAALSLGELDTITATAEQNKARLSVIHNVLFVPVVQKAKTLIEKGEIGELIALHITQTEHSGSQLVTDPSHWCHKLPGGIFGEMLPHPLYLAAAFMGDLQVVDVKAGRYTQRPHIANDEVRVNLAGKNGLVTIAAMLRGVGNLMFIDFVGTKGQLKAALGNGIFTVHKVSPGDSRIPMGIENMITASRWLMGTAGVALKTISGRYHSGHDQIIRSFYKALRGRGALPVLPDEIRNVTRLYETVTALIPTDTSRHGVFTSSS